MFHPYILYFTLIVWAVFGGLCSGCGARKSQAEDFVHPPPVTNKPSEELSAPAQDQNVKKTMLDLRVDGRNALKEGNLAVATQSLEKLVEISNQKYPVKVRVEAIGGVESLICEKFETARNLPSEEVLELIITKEETEPDPRMRERMVDAIKTVTECIGSETATAKAVQAFFNILVQDNDLDVLDLCARELTWAQEKKWNLPEDARERIIQVVMQHAAAYDPDAAWASFTRGPYSFEELPELHDVLIELPRPKSSSVTYYGLRQLGRTIHWAKSKEPSQIRVNAFLLQILLHSKNVVKQSKKNINASREYRSVGDEIDDQCSNLNLEEKTLCMIRNHRNLEHSETVTQGVRVGLEASYASDIVKLKEEFGGPEEALAELVNYTDKVKVPDAKIRISAWTAIKRAHVDSMGSLLRVPSNDLIEQLKVRLNGEKDPGVATVAKATANTLKSIK